ncbi:MAG: hypothetical protein IJO48_02770 [Clostridia bacterium]|nr:hypothetical protein [Clostridia bacterium]
MKRRFVAMLLVIAVLAMATACSKKDTQEIELLYPESKSTPGPVSSIWSSEQAGTLTFYEGNFVKVEFTPDYEYLLKDYGMDGRDFDNNSQYHCNFFEKLTETTMEEASSFYIWFINGSIDYNCQFECKVENDTMTLSAYWPYEAFDMVFTKTA